MSGACAVCCHLATVYFGAPIRVANSESCRPAARCVARSSIVVTVARTIGFARVRCGATSSALRSASVASISRPGS